MACALRIASHGRDFELMRGQWCEDGAAQPAACTLDTGQLFSMQVGHARCGHCGCEISVDSSIPPLWLGPSKRRQWPASAFDRALRPSFMSPPIRVLTHAHARTRTHAHARAHIGRYLMCAIRSVSAVLVVHVDVVGPGRWRVFFDAWINNGFSHSASLKNARNQ